MIFTNEKVHGGSFKAKFSNRLKRANNLTIATGYFGTDLIHELESMIVDVSKKGRCRILLGMVFHGGITEKQKKCLAELDSKLREINPSNGIYISRKDYHGKVYQIDDEIFVGSSNFSRSGFESRWECTAQINDESTQKETVRYLNFLFSQKTTERFSDVEFFSRSKPVSLRASKFLKDYKVSALPSGSIVDQMDIELRVDSQPASSLNLFFDIGRKNPNGLYAPRPWYEIEITASAVDIRNTCYPKSELVHEEGKSRKGKFFAYIEDAGLFYRLEMKVASANGKALMTSRACGGRETLGRYIKGKLEDKGLLKKGDQITSETLEEYGRNFIRFKKVDDKNYILEF